MQQISVQQPATNWSDDMVDISSSDPNPVLRVVTVEDPLLLSIQQQPNGSYLYSGYLYELWKMVAEHLNLRYEMLPLPVSDYGSLNANGTWTGMVGELVYGRADIALASLEMNLARASVIDYLDACPVNEFFAGFYLRQGQTHSPLLSQLLGSLLKPLDTNVWWALLVSLLVLSVVLRFTLRFSPSRRVIGITENDMGWSDCLLNCFMCFVNQGWAAIPNSLAARTVTITCWMLSLIIHASYTAKLISFMTLTTEELPINKLAQFLERPDWRLAVPRGAAEITYWRVSSDEHERALYERYTAGKGVVFLDVSSNESFRVVIEERVLTFIDFQYVPPIIGHDSCVLAPLTKRPGFKRFAFIGISKQQKKLRQEINQVLLRIKSQGLDSRLRSRWVTSGDIRCESLTGYRALAISDLYSVVVIVPLSVCISVSLLAFEKVIRRKSSKRNA